MQKILLLRLVGSGTCPRKSIILSAAQKQPWTHLLSARPLSLSSQCRNLNNPFSPKSDKSKIEVKQFLQENARLAQPKDLRFRDRADPVEKTFSSLLGTSTLGDKFRKQFKLDDNYKLVYMAENERLLLIVFASLNVCFPILLGILLVLGIAEYTGASDLSRSFEHPYQMMSVVTFFFTLYYLVSLSLQNRLVYRIYYNEADKLFALIHQRRILKFDCLKFKQADIALKESELKGSNIFPANLKKSMGNVTIKNRSWFIEFDRFNSRKSVEEFIGEKYAGVVMNPKPK